MAATKSTREEILDKASKVKKDVNKRFGFGTTTMLSDEPLDMERISSGSYQVDDVIGGGWPTGRIVEIFGWESSGKTTVAITGIAEAQREGILCGFIDAEHAFDRTYAEALGVDVELLLFCQPDNGEEALNVAEQWIDLGVGFIVVDSVAALTPKAELEGEMGENKMGLHSRMMSQAMRKLSGKIAKTSTIAIFLNQIREKLGVMYGSPETTPGGNALKFYSSIRVRISRVTPKQDSDRQVSKIYVIKNKTAPPFRSVEVEMKYGEGIVTAKDVLQEALELGILTKKGAGWISYNGEKIAQGKDKFNLWLEENPDFIQHVQEFKANKK